MPVGSLPIGSLVADLDGIVGIEADDAVVLDVDARHAVARGRDDEAVVEADFERAGLDLAVPIGLAVAEAEVPFADDAGGVAGLLQDRRPAWCGRAR